MILMYLLLMLFVYLVNMEDCNVTANSDAVGIPYDADGSRTRQHRVYSCISSSVNDNYYVHMISMFSASSYYSRNFADDPTYTSNVCIQGNGSLIDKPLIIVLTNYGSTQWILHIPQGIVVSKVILVNLLQN